MDPLFLLLLWVLSNGKKPVTVAPGPSPATPARPPTEPGRAVPVVVMPPNKLVVRANQKRARDWIPYLVKGGASPEIAAALARWIGIESSGNPLALSRIGERGLLQSTKTTALKDKLFTPREWDELQSPATKPERHAALALKQFAFHVRRAKVRVANPPPIGTVDWVFYAKMDHTRPVDLKEAKPHGAAASMARDLQTRWGNDPERMLRLAHATVAAFGKATV